MRLLALPAVGFLMSLSPARAEAEIETANRAVEGLEAVGDLLQYMGEPGADFSSRLETSAVFIRNIAKHLIPDKQTVELVIQNIDASLELHKKRNVIVKEMDDLVAKMKAGVTPEEEAKLRERMRELLAQLKELTAESFRVTLRAAGLSDEEAKEILEASTGVARLVELVETSTIMKYQPYA